eukprot:5390567-Pyramimonas_sp.AAC.1
MTSAVTATTAATTTTTTTTTVAAAAAAIATTRPRDGPTAPRVEAPPAPEDRALGAADFTGVGA